MVYALIILVQLCDYLTFACAVSVLPIGGELNPLARWAFGLGGVMGVGIFKAVGTGIVLLGITLAAEHPFAGYLIVAVIVIGLIGAISNTLAVVMTYG